MTTYGERQFEELVAYFRSAAPRDLDGTVRERQGISLTQARKLVDNGIAEWVEEPAARYLGKARRAHYRWRLRDKS